MVSNRLFALLLLDVLVLDCVFVGVGLSMSVLASVRLVVLILKVFKVAIFAAVVRGLEGVEAFRLFIVVIGISGLTVVRTVAVHALVSVKI